MKFIDEEPFIDGQITYWKSKFRFNNLKEEINKRIGIEGNPLQYEGFNMGKTHDQDNVQIDKHNEKILQKFSNLIDTKDMHSMLDFWKGTGFFSPTREFNDAIKEFGGWTTHNILYWILTTGNYLRTKWNFHEENKDIDKWYTDTLEEEDTSVHRNITPELRYKTLKRQKWKCNQCSCNLKYNKDSDWEGEVAHIDHIHPFSKKESYLRGEININESVNLQALCPKCNKTKSNKLCQ